MLHQPKCAAAILAALLLVCTPLASSAQPGPEHKKLNALVGKWNMELETKATASAPASKASGSEDCEWFANLHVICRTEATGAAGLYKATRIVSYVPAMKQYSSYSVDSLGYAVLTMGQVSGSTWTFSSEAGGYKLRSITKTSDNGYTATVEYAGADGKWTPSMSIKATRAK